MSTGIKLNLFIGPEVAEKTAKRISYCFDVFCKYWGIEQSSEDKDAVLIVYGKNDNSKAVSIPNLYKLRPLSEPVSGYVHYQLSARHKLRPHTPAEIPVFHGICPITNRPDWLGEAFEWLSGAHEFSCKEFDSFGRVPYHKTLCGEFGICPEVPYVNIIFDCLLQDISIVAGQEWQEQIRTRMADKGFIVAATHDVDFLPISLSSVMKRYIKNFLIAILVKRSAGLVKQIFFQSFKSVFGGNSLNNCFFYLFKKEKALGVRSTWNFLAGRLNPRDGNYEVDKSIFEQYIRPLQDAGFEIGLHASYSCLDNPGRVRQELEKLRKVTGLSISGNRCHCLRNRGNELIRVLQESGCLYDTTFGFSNRPGFRNGAAFAFPIYDFDSEQSLDIIELPMIIMDTILATDKLRESAKRVYDAARSWGPGQVSILWHDTCFSQMQMPSAISELYWSLATSGDKWVSAAEVLQTI